MRALLIEDSASYAELVQIWMARDMPRIALDHVWTLADGLSALEVTPPQYAVILLDLTLPDARQFMAIPKVHEVAARHQTPIIVLSGTPDSLIPEPLRAQYTRYIEKDGTAPALIAAIREMTRYA